MTKEQEVIKRLNFHKEYARLSSNRVVISETDLETVLNMLKENSAEIEQKNTELAEKSAEIEKKDKIIDLMAEYIDGDDTSLANYLYRKNGKCNKKMIKQYFDLKGRNNERRTNN